MIVLFIGPSSNHRVLGTLF